MKKQQSGFTLIELVVVIVVLGLLAATALPKYINITSDARRSSINGVAGGLRAAAALGQAQYVVNGNTAALSISMGGSNITVLDEVSFPGLGGKPDGVTASGIRLAMPDPSDYTITDVNSQTGAITYRPLSGGGVNCQVVYTPNGAPDPVETFLTSC